MKKIINLLFIVVLLWSCNTEKNDYLKISREMYRSKMKAAWIGQMAGVGWGFPTEFKWIDTIVPDDKVPAWENEMINQHDNDDMYVEMTFLASMQKYGIDVSIRQAGIDFANTGYPLWAANYTARENLRKGIAPPESSHPEYNHNCDDIDYQIEADYSGIIAPGMPNVPIQLGEKFGRIMNYGDGVYGGQFVGGMYSAAYFTNNIKEIIEAGLKCIPSESNYYKIITDVVKWYDENPDDWKTTWKLIMDKYYRTDSLQPYWQQQKNISKAIDSKINGAYIVMGLLYGKGDMDKTISISMQCGLDSDCNPSNAGGILATCIGYENIPDKYKSALNYDEKFSNTDYNFNELLEVSEDFTRQFIVLNGGRIEKDEQGNEIFYIKATKATPSRFEPSYSPGPFDANNKFTDTELAQIKAAPSSVFDEYFSSLGLKARLLYCRRGYSGKTIEWNGASDVLATTPMSNERGIEMEFTNNLNDNPDKSKAYFNFKVGHDKDEQWRLIINEGQVDTLVCAKNSKNGWMDIKIPYATELYYDLRVEAMNVDGKQVKNYFTEFKIGFE